MTKQEEQMFRAHIRFLLRQNFGGIDPLPEDFQGSEWLRSQLDLKTIQQLYADELKLLDGGE